MAGQPAKRRHLAGIDEVAAFFGLSPRTLHDERQKGVGVGALAFRVGRHLRWDWADIDAFVEAQKAKPIESPKRGYDTPPKRRRAKRPLRAA